VKTRWILVRPNDGTTHTFSIDEEEPILDTVNVDGKTYLKKAGRRFWDEYIRIGYVLDKEITE